MTTTAYFLVIHGSRNRKTHDAADKLQQLITFKIKSKNIITQEKYLETDYSSQKLITGGYSNLAKVPLVEIAALELANSSLNESLVEFSLKADSLGFNRIKVLPLFLAPGVHVREDIPLEIKLAIKQIKERVTIKLSPFLGKYSEMIDLLGDKFQTLSSQKRVLMVHGSSLPKVKKYYQNLAQRLDAVTAYWSIEPSLSDRVEASIAVGEKSIGIVPYFLFPGKITETIASEVSALQAKYPQVDLSLAEPLGATDALAELIVRKIIAQNI